MKQQQQQQQQQQSLLCSCYKGVEYYKEKIVKEKEHRHSEIAKANRAEWLIHAEKLQLY